jgi:hypothetical protein
MLAARLEKTFRSFSFSSSLVVETAAAASPDSPSFLSTIEEEAEEEEVKSPFFPAISLSSD